MISSYPKGKQTEKGAATLLFAVILIVLSTLIVLFAANFGRMLSQSVANQNRNSQAFEAAMAGMEFGIVYLQQNSPTVIASASGGFINYSNASMTNITLPNGSRFSFVYTNPTANNYNTILITSTGISDDSSATRVVRQIVRLGSLLVNAGNRALVSKGNVNMSGNAITTNTSTDLTIESAGSVTFGGNAHTVITSGTSSTPSGTGSDVQQNQTSLANMTQNDFFASYFGTTSMTAIQGKVTNLYTNSASTNYSSTLNGMTGASIWINQTGGSTASITGTTTVGSAAQPVLLIINGPFSMSGNVTIYGFIFIIGPTGITTLTGNNNIIGGLATTDDLNMSGNSNITFDPTVLSNLQMSSSMRYYAKVAGSWRDF